MLLNVIKISFNGKGFPCDQTKLNRFIYVKNIAVKLYLCYKIVVTVVVVAALLLLEFYCTLCPVYCEQD